MFPVILTEIEYMDFQQEERKYKDLLEEEYRIILSEQEEIKRKAGKLYSDVKKGHKFYTSLSSNFSLLEQEYIKFNK